MVQVNHQVQILQIEIMEELTPAVVVEVLEQDLLLVLMVVVDQVW